MKPREGTVAACAAIVAVATIVTFGLLSEVADLDSRALGIGPFWTKANLQILTTQTLDNLLTSEALLPRVPKQVSRDRKRVAYTPDHVAAAVATVVDAASRTALSEAIATRLAESTPIRLALRTAASDADVTAPVNAAITDAVLERWVRTELTDAELEKALKESPPTGMRELRVAVADVLRKALRSDLPPALAVELRRETAPGSRRVEYLRAASADFAARAAWTTGASLFVVLSLVSFVVAVPLLSAHIRTAIISLCAIVILAIAVCRLPELGPPHLRELLRQFASDNSLARLAGWVGWLNFAAAVSAVALFGASLASCLAIPPKAPTNSETAKRPEVSAVLSQGAAQTAAQSGAASPPAVTAGVFDPAVLAAQALKGASGSGSVATVVLRAPSTPQVEALAWRAYCFRTCLNLSTALLVTGIFELVALTQLLKPWFSTETVGAVVDTGAFASATVVGAMFSAVLLNLYIVGSYILRTQAEAAIAAGSAASDVQAVMTEHGLNTTTGQQIMRLAQAVTPLLVTVPLSALFNVVST